MNNYKPFCAASWISPGAKRACALMAQAVYFQERRIKILISPGKTPNESISRHRKLILLLQLKELHYKI